MSTKKIVSVITSVATVVTTTGAAFLPMAAGADQADLQYMESLEAQGLQSIYFGHMANDPDVWEALKSSAAAAVSFDIRNRQANILGSVALAQSPDPIPFVGALSVGTRARLIDINDGQLLVATIPVANPFNAFNPFTLKAFSLANPSIPSLTVSVTVPTISPQPPPFTGDAQFDGVQDALVSGNRLYVARFGVGGSWPGGEAFYGRIHLHDFPSGTALEDIHFRAATLLNRQGSLLYSRNGNNPGAVGIFDLTTSPIDPNPLSAQPPCLNNSNFPFCFPTLGFAWLAAGDWIQGSTYYDVNISPTGLGGDLTEIDVSSPANPVVSCENNIVPHPEHATANYFDGNLLYTVSFVTDTLRIFDLSTPCSPALVGTLSGAANFLDGPASITKADDTLFIGTAFPAGITAVDVSNPSAPATVGRTSNPSNPAGLVAFGTNLYAGDFFTGTVRIFDISGFVAPPLQTCALDALTAMGMRVGQYPEMDAALNASCSDANPATDNLTIATTVIEPNYKMKPNEILVLAQNVTVKNNIIGDNASQNAVFIGNNVTINGNSLKVEDVWVGGTNNKITGNVNHSVSLHIGPNASLQVGGSINDLQTLDIETNGTLTVGQHVDVFVDIDSAGTLNVGGTFSCNGLTGFPTAQGTINAGTNACTFVTASAGGSGSNLAVYLPLLALAALGLAVYLRPKKQA